MSTRLPRYIEIRRDLENRIMSGDWPPGHRVPSEAALCETYGCARMTVNKALSALAETGLIVRRRRSGSFVAVPVAQEPVLEISDIESEVRRLGQAYDFTLLGRELRPARAKDAARLGVARGDKVLAIIGLHRADGRPFVLEDRLISLDAVPDAAKMDFTTRPPSPWLVAQIPWSEAEHRIRAEAAGGPVAQHLAIAAREACLVVERITWQAGTPITQVRLTYPGTGHELVARFSPASQPAAAASA